jgi:hemoglobin
MSGTLYEQLGGQAALLAAVDLFYEKVLADPQVSAFFAELDMPQQVRKQVAFMTWAFDGPKEYRGRSLREAHARLVSKRGLTDIHFDRLVQHLADTLRELAYPAELAGEAVSRIAALRAQVLNR